MKSYLNCYRYRLQQIVISVIATAFVIIICGVLFGGRLKKISNQLFNYSNADYNILYTLNYDAMLNNTCVYPDTDILVYLDNSKTKRIAASLVMKKPEAQYDLNYLQKLNTIGKDQVLLPSNLREKYNLNVGDTVYIEYPYKSELCAVTIGSITNYEYDYCNPNIANDIGVAFIDADNGYIENTNCKYILFSKSSQADTLADYPQIINDIVNKGTNQSKVFKQGVPALVFSILLSIGSIVISNIVLFSKSLGIFKRLYLKGAKRKSLVAISFGEKIVLSIIPLIISECLMSLIIPINSAITVLFFLIPLLVFSLYTIVSTVVISGKLKAKG